MKVRIYLGPIPHLLRYERKETEGAICNND